MNQNKIKNIVHRSFMRFDIVANMVDPVGNKVQVPWFVDFYVSRKNSLKFSLHKDAATGVCSRQPDRQVEAQLKTLGARHVRNYTDALCHEVSSHIDFRLKIFFRMNRQLGTVLYNEANEIYI